MVRYTWELQTRAEDFPAKTVCSHGCPPCGEDFKVGKCLSSKSKRMGAAMLQALVGLLIGFVVMAVMVVCCLTATVLLLVIISWVVEGLARLVVPRRPSR